MHESKEEIKKKEEDDFVKFMAQERSSTNVGASKRTSIF